MPVEASHNTSQTNKGELVRTTNFLIFFHIASFSMKLIKIKIRDPVRKLSFG